MLLLLYACHRQLRRKRDGNETSCCLFFFFTHTALLFPTPISQLTSSRMMSIKTLPTLVPRPMEGSSKYAFTGCWISSLLSKLRGVFESPKFNIMVPLSNLGLGKLPLPITSVHWIKHSTCYTTMDSSKYESSESWGGRGGPIMANDNHLTYASVMLTVEDTSRISWQHAHLKSKLGWRLAYSPAVAHL